eukprot:TRINITY_DN7651_c0_g2_i1.p1 TRINITY_DN7651_c0_g2~~TRINITY_DN7651_c0_g2_i1.p1  ORF type:complete len:312 (+),score=97.35 TRINITY_DN7651_c0_g2_i1:183-1118(+)
MDADQSGEVDLREWCAYLEAEGATVCQQHYEVLRQLSPAMAEQPRFGEMGLHSAEWLWENPPAPDGCFRAACHKVAMHPRFNDFIMIMILLNCLVILGQWVTIAGGSLSTDTAEAVELGFVVIFVIEFFIKWMALGWIRYWQDNWNKMDFALVVLSVILLAMEQLAVLDALAFFPPSALRALRFVRVLGRIARVLGRFLRLVRLVFTRDTNGPDDDEAAWRVRLRNAPKLKKRSKMLSADQMTVCKAQSMVAVTEELHTLKDRIQAVKEATGALAEAMDQARSDHVCGGCVGVVLGLGIGLVLVSIVSQVT